jgi:hypothetical protein
VTARLLCLWCRVVCRSQRKYSCRGDEGGVRRGSVSLLGSADFDDAPHAKPARTHRKLTRDYQQVAFKPAHNFLQEL